MEFNGEILDSGFILIIAATCLDAWLGLCHVDADLYTGAWLAMCRCRRGQRLLVGECVCGHCHFLWAWTFVGGGCHVFWDRFSPVLCPGNYYAFRDMQRRNLIGDYCHIFWDHFSRVPVRGIAKLSEITFPGSPLLSCPLSPCPEDLCLCFLLLH